MLASVKVSDSIFYKSLGPDLVNILAFSVNGDEDEDVMIELRGEYLDLFLVLTSKPTHGLDQLICAYEPLNVDRIKYMLNVLSDYNIVTFENLLLGKLNVKSIPELSPLVGDWDLRVKDHPLVVLKPDALSSKLSLSNYAICGCCAT